MNNRDANERIDELLNLMDLASKRNRLYGECSGGEN